MSLMLLALLAAAQDPIVVTADDRAKPKKPQQVCEFIELTGSRTRKKVCRDVNGELPVLPGVSSSALGKNRAPQVSGAIGGGGGPPTN